MVTKLDIVRQNAISLKLKYDECIQKGDVFKMRSWRNTISPLAIHAMSNKWFEVLGLFEIGQVQTGIFVQILWLKIYRSRIRGPYGRCCERDEAGEIRSHPT